MKDLVLFLAQQLVTHPEAVEVTEVKGARASLVELRVAKEDVGRAIGKHGGTAEALRTIATAVAARTTHKLIRLDIVEWTRRAHAATASGPCVSVRAGPFPVTARSIGLCGRSLALLFWPIWRVRLVATDHLVDVRFDNLQEVCKLSDRLKFSGACCNSALPSDSRATQIHPYLTSFSQFAPLRVPSGSGAVRAWLL